MSRVRMVYRIAANATVLAVVILTLIHVAIRVYQYVTPDFVFEQLSPVVQANYAHMPRADVVELWGTMSRLRYQFIQFAGIVESEFHSRLVNIDARGIRASRAGATTELDRAIWVFGGSTTFGFAVADHETLPAQLEAILARPVANLGVRGNASRNENALLQYYLHAGYRPAAAVFLDGVNESCAETTDPELSDVVRDAQRGYSWEFAKPLLFAARQIRERRRLQSDDVPQLTLTCRDAGRDNPLRTLHANTLREREALCGRHGIRCLTFVQPFAGLHGRHDEIDPAERAYLRGLFEHLEPGWRAAGATFVTNAFDGYDRHAFIDNVHYSAATTSLLAKAIAVSLR